jgi:hypothetical protein
MRIDHMPDRIPAEVRQGLQDARTRCSDPGIHKHFAIRSREHADVAAGALEHADITAKRVNLDRRIGGRSPHTVNDVARLGKDLAWRQPSAGGCKGCRAEAAQAEATTRELGLVCIGHGIFLDRFNRGGMDVTIDET